MMNGVLGDLAIFCVDIAKNFFCLPMELNMIIDSSVLDLEIELFKEFSNFGLYNDILDDTVCTGDITCGANFSIC